jgi:hypothetical protein
MQRVSFVVGLCLIFSTLSNPAYIRAQPTISPHIYQIVVAGCEGLPKQRTQTGFRVYGIPGIITALHGVVGCKTVSAVPSDNSPAYADLQIDQVDLARDVVLLSSDRLHNVRGIGFQVGVAKKLMGLSTIGHPLGLTMQLRSRIELRSPPRMPLGDLVPPAVYHLITKRSSPAAHISVLSVEGHLTAGHSGAPLLDAETHVVGVANGGLQGGTVEIAWAIPWEDLELRPVAMLAGALEALGKANISTLFTYPTDEEVSGRGRLAMIVGGDDRAWR